MSGSRNARNSASIINRTNVGGGPKKAGTRPWVGGATMGNNPHYLGAPQGNARTTINFRIIQTQVYGVRATHGRMGG